MSILKNLFTKKSLKNNVKKCCLNCKYMYVNKMSGICECRYNPPTSGGFGIIKDPDNSWCSKFEVKEGDSE